MSVLCRRVAGVVGLSALLLGPVLAAGPTQADSVPDFQMPFACGNTWLGSTRASHSPSPNAIDWTRDGSDLGQPVVASAPGTVSVVSDLGGTSYGLYVVIDHGGGWSTLHAHLRKSFVVPGEGVDQGQLIGLLGASGDATGPHLHYEQRSSSSGYITYQPAVFGSVAFAYNTWLTSKNCPDVPVVGDWNGDGASDLGTFRRSVHGGTFREQLPSGAVTVARLGLATRQPLVGDWNGDGTSDVGTFDNQRRTFTLSTTSATGTTSVATIVFGSTRALAVSGDWNGDGSWDVGTYGPKSSTFRLRAASGAVSEVHLGGVVASGSLPVTGDWNGDGRWDVGTYDPATGTFTLVSADDGSRPGRCGSDRFTRSRRSGSSTATPAATSVYGTPPRPRFGNESVPRRSRGASSATTADLAALTSPAAGVGLRGGGGGGRHPDR